MLVLEGCMAVYIIFPGKASTRSLHLVSNVIDHFSMDYVPFDRQLSQLHVHVNLRYIILFIRQVATVVVVKAPTATCITTPTKNHTSRCDYFLTLSIVMMVFCCIFGGWWSLLFTIAAVAIASAVSNIYMYMDVLYTLTLITKFNALTMHILLYKHKFKAGTMNNTLNT